MITATLNNVAINNYDSISVSHSLDTVSGVFSMITNGVALADLPYRVGDLCVITVDDTTVINGYIDIIESSYNKSTHKIMVKGRDRTADIIDSTIGGEYEFNTPITLVELIRQILIQSNLSTISVVSQVDATIRFSADELISAEVGGSIFELMSGYCAKKGLLITKTGDGNILLTRGVGVDSGFRLSNRIAGDTYNNILGAKSVIDHSDRYHSYTIVSGTNVAGSNLGGLGTTAAIVANIGTAVDDDVRSTRVMTMVADKPSDNPTLATKSAWVANVHRAKSFSYLATVQGHRDDVTGNVWYPNNRVYIEDDINNVYGKYLINSVTYNQSVNKGSTTDVGCVTPDAYSLVASEPQEQKQQSAASSFGDRFK